MLRTRAPPCPHPPEKAAQRSALTVPGGAQCLVLQGKNLLVQLLSLLELALFHETRGLAEGNKQGRGWWCEHLPSIRNQWTPRWVVQSATISKVQPPPEGQSTPGKKPG